jgi:EAL domain-containing protein (putative c-di-GMP-specific phosphodiesterase class I)/GGDEF domain-containing protein
MRTLLKNMSEMYDLARVVDPIECRILEFHSDGRISMSDSCYGIWNADQKCVNCSSAVACRTGCHQEKAERFQDQVYHIQSNPVTVKLPDGGAYEAVVELVSVEKEADSAAVNDRAAENTDHRAAQYQALHDSLTKALTADAFYELSRERIVRDPDSLWVMITANIKDFRLINTLFGDLKGNEVLVKTAALLRRLAEESGGLCGRLGGDQFALLLPRDRYQKKSLLNAAQALAEAFNSGLFTFCIHFGVYEMEDASIPLSVMFDRANSALRTIRDDLRETVASFDDSMMRRSLFEHEIISGFEEALRTEQFRMYLQPLVREDGGIFGAEALVRWHRPDGTVVKPDDFIGTLERAGLIHELDMFIWERAVRQLSLWKGTDKQDLSISVNMSARDFYSVDLYRVLTELIEKYGVDSRLLRLEITETALLEDPEKGNAVVSRLREKGFLVEIDDFGKGYSSLSLLKDIHADVLKIDMGLLCEIECQQRSRIILESVINMAGSLGMDVITEGVETEEQLRSLTSMGCRHFQGYYFSVPLPVEEFERKLAAAQ